MELGADVSWNLFKIFQAPKAIESTEAKEKVLKERRLALSMNVLMQVHLAKINHIMARQDFAISNGAHGVQKIIMGQIKVTARDLRGEMSLINEEMKMLTAELRWYQSFNGLQDSFGRLLVSVGIDPVPAVKKGLTVDQLAKTLEDNIKKWAARDLKEVAGMASLGAAPAPTKAAAGAKERKAAGQKAAPKPAATTAPAKPAPVREQLLGRCLVKFARIRTNPSLKTNILGALGANGRVELLGAGQGWFNIEPQGVRGWVRGDLLKIKGDVAEQLKTRPGIGKQTVAQTGWNKGACLCKE